VVEDGAPRLESGAPRPLSSAPPCSADALELHAAGLTVKKDPSRRWESAFRQTGVTGDCSKRSPELSACPPLLCGVEPRRYGVEAGTVIDEPGWPGARPSTQRDCRKHYCVHVGAAVSPMRKGPAVLLRDPTHNIQTHTLALIVSAVLTDG